MRQVQGGGCLSFENLREQEAPSVIEPKTQLSSHCREAKNYDEHFTCVVFLSTATYYY